MRFKSLGVLIMLTLFISSTAVDVSAVGRRVFKDQNESTAKTAKKPKKDGKEKPFKELVKDMVKIEGLFTFYHDTVENKMLMAVKPEQFGPVYLCNETRSKSEGSFFDNGSMANSYPFYLKRVGKTIMIMEKNLRVRANSASPMYKAVQSGISDGLIESTTILSAPEDSTNAVLVDPSDLFVKDAQNIGYFVGQRAKTGIRFDKKNSYFGIVKSFPNNTEIDVHLHYASSRPLPGETMQNPYSLYHVYHYSLSTLPETDYTPRLADDRVGYFMTMYEDYTNLDEEEPMIRYINRWNLKKKNPGARISEPVEPIVYWVENTVPEEYRDAIAEGIEFWNQSFEKIGFRNAIVAKQMPADAEWDPADVRYNTVRWIVIPGGGYAVGPSRANPFTGQIYDADIRVSSDFVRYMFKNMDNFIGPLSFDGKFPEEEDILHEFHKYNNENPHMCNYGSESAKEAAFGLAYALSQANTLVDKDSLTKEYVHSYLVELVAHEVGHTLGFRHNFKASTIYSLDEIQDRKFTHNNGITGTVMDYAPPNIAPLNQPQGEFYMSTPGPYDDWVIEYGYSDFGEITPEEEKEKLQSIASRSAEPGLIYATDEDAFGSSIKSIDPYCNLFDLGNDPIAYANHKITLTKELWNNAIHEFEKPGNSYHKLYLVFQSGWRSYIETASHVSKFVGGLHHHRHHIGDPGGTVPFKVVSAKEQQRAMDFLTKNVFAADAFDLPNYLWNKLQPNRLPDFSWSVYSVPQVDYPIHTMALGMQNLVLTRLYSPYVLGRLLNNLERYEAGAERYTMYDMFTDVRSAIWSELFNVANVNSYRRQLQLSHLNRLSGIYLSTTALFPHDALTLAGNELDVIYDAAEDAVKSSSINSMTRAHYKEVLRQIDAARGAKRNYSILTP